jgi:large subunit ribosomal protein L10
MNEKTLENKKKIVEELKEKIDSASVLVLSDYRRVSVKEITKLRKALYAEESEYKIYKNTMLKRAVEASGFSELSEHLEGPTAVLLGYKDPVAPLKALVDFVKEVEKGDIKAGLIEKSFVDGKRLLEIAKLPPKEVLLAKVVGGFQSPIYGLVNVLQGTIRKFVYALNAILEKKQQQGEVK